MFGSNEQHPQGDILVFLTGREEIDRCLQMISDYLHRCASLRLVHVMRC